MMNVDAAPRTDLPQKLDEFVERQIKANQQEQEAYLDQLLESGPSAQEDANDHHPEGQTFEHVQSPSKALYATQPENAIKLGPLAECVGSADKIEQRDLLSELESRAQKIEQQLSSNQNRQTETVHELDEFFSCIKQQIDEIHRASLAEVQELFDTKQRKFARMAQDIQKQIETVQTGEAGKGLLKTPSELEKIEEVLKVIDTTLEETEEANEEVKIPDVNVKFLQQMLSCKVTKTAEA